MPEFTVRPEQAADYSPSYYGRLGFEHAALLDIVIPLPDEAPDEAGQVARLSAYDPDDPTCAAR